MRLTDRSLVVAMCIGQVGNLLPHVVVPAVMPQHLMPLWQLSGAQAGFMASAFPVGYMVAVPILTALTDRIDARAILCFNESVHAASVCIGVISIGSRCARRSPLYLQLRSFSASNRTNALGWKQPFANMAVLPAGVSGLE